METVIYFVRHAQALPRPDVPEPEWELSPRGTSQARELVPVLQALAVERLYSSPFRRCLDTLQPFASAARLPLHVHEGLRERRLSDRWLGDFRDVWQRSQADLSFALDGGESSLACRCRIGAAVDELLARHAGETLALGSHGYSISLFLTTVDESFGLREASALRTPDLVRVVHDGAAFAWDRAFSAGPAFDRLACDFRQTPGIVA